MYYVNWPASAADANKDDDEADSETDEWDGDDQKNYNTRDKSRPS